MLAVFGCQAAERRSAGDVGACGRRPHPGAEAALHGSGFPASEGVGDLEPRRRGRAVGARGVVGGRGGEARVVSAGVDPGRTLGNNVAAGLGARREEKERRHQRDGQPPGHLGQLSNRVSHHSPLRVRTAGLRLGWGSSWSCSRSIQEEGSIRRPAPIRPARCSLLSRPPPTPATARRRLRSRV